MGLDVFHDGREGLHLIGADDPEVAGPDQVLTGEVSAPGEGLNLHDIGQDLLEGRLR